MAIAQPPTDVSVTHEQKPDEHRVDVTVKRDGSNRNEVKTYSGQGQSSAEAIKDVVKKLLDDPTSGEFIRRG